MAFIVHSWGETQPPAELVALMITKASSWHIVTAEKLVLVFDHRWPNADGTAESYDPKVWHLRCNNHITPSPDSRGVESLQAMTEGLAEGYALGMKMGLIAPRPRKKKDVAVSGE